MWAVSLSHPHRNRRGLGEHSNRNRLHPRLEQMERGLQNTEVMAMTCRICGRIMEDRVTDLPFKVGESSIVIVKGLPVIQCPHCNEYVLTDTVMTHVEQILDSADKTAELEIVRYAA